MELALLITVLILGAVEGLTEFLPVSSTGHLIIVGDLLGFTDAHAKTFEIFIQLGAILAVVWHYRQRLSKLVTGLGHNVAQRFWLNLAIAFVPAALVGLALHKQIKVYLFNPIAVAGALIVGGVVILLIERTPRRARVQDLESLRPGDALKIGLGQTLSLFPGVSRAGATIMSGLLTGLSRTAATEFSFFLAIPIMLAATSYELFTSRAVLNGESIALFALGFATAFVTALVVIRAFLAYVSHHDFTAFAYYRIVFGSLVLIYFW